MLGKTNFDISFLGILLTAVVAVVVDLRSRRIPNALTFTSVALGLLLPLVQSIASGAGFFTSSFLVCLFGVVLGLVLFLPLFVFGWIGAGDVKLLMAFASWGGANFVINLAIWSIVFGGILGFFQLLLRGRLVDFLSRFWIFIRSWGYKELEPVAFRGDQTLTLPFAIPMSLAAVGQGLKLLPEALQWFN